MFGGGRSASNQPLHHSICDQQSSQPPQRTTPWQPTALPPAPPPLLNAHSAAAPPSPTHLRQLPDHAVALGPDELLDGRVVLDDVGALADLHPAVRGGQDLEPAVPGEGLGDDDALAAALVVDLWGVVVALLGGGGACQGPRGWQRVALRAHGVHMARYTRPQDHWIMSCDMERTQRHAAAACAHLDGHAIGARSGQRPAAALARACSGERLKRAQQARRTLPKSHRV